MRTWGQELQRLLGYLMYGPWCAFFFLVSKFSILMMLVFTNLLGWVVNQDNHIEEYIDSL